MSLCFLLTAGLGTRLQPFSNIKPKPCLPFLNLPLMYYGFYLAQKAGFKDYLFNTHHLPLVLEKNLQELKPYCEKMSVSDETTKLLGSGGALWKAKSILSQHDYFLVANGDEVLIPQDTTILSQLVDKFKLDQCLGTLLTCDHPDLLKGLKPVWVNASGDVQAFGMTPQSSEHKPTHYTGYKIFSKRIFDYIREGESNIFYDAVKAARDKGERVSTLHVSNAAWYETGNFNSFLSASHNVANDHWGYIESIQSFFSQKLTHAKIDASTSVVHFANEALAKNVNWTGFNVVGKHVSIAPQACINQSILCDLAQVHPEDSIQNAFVF